LNTLPAPVFTNLDAATQGLTALVYLAIGAAAWLRGPRDIRTRVFFGLALSNLVALVIPVMWVRGVLDPAAVPRGAMALVLSGLGVAALVLFHFTQVFPRRRPWIRTAGIQMPIGYVLIPAVIAGLVLYMPQKVDELSPGYVAAFFVFGFPLIVLLAIVLPVAAILSLLKSHRDAARDGLDRMKRPIEWILIGQVAGGTLAVVFAPVLTVLAPNSIAQSAVKVAICVLGLVTPLAFASAIWKHDLLAIDPD
jgi:hypothetical protein